MNRAILIGIILFAYIIYIAFKHKEIWKKLTFMQTLGVLLTFIFVTGIGGTILFYGVRFLISFTSNEVLSIVIQFFTAIIVVIFGVLLFNTIVSSITNGILPIKRTPRR
ncbi:hypothetical protein [Virgibacillus oceani]|uniref:Uncharacterized protein n=1 Tax=Virgibacillus oceani TaxID=1479511 RepID=A0A917M089_9BACI|nr:hypothetical protein [Virgibacillus oceani]GGG70672.1 hypothetical protein GCM10011398_13520 [Virgibacillus oceani]